MGKHKSDKLSKTWAKDNNKAGSSQQSPQMGTNQKNQYR